MPYKPHEDIFKRRWYFTLEYNAIKKCLPLFQTIILNCGKYDYYIIAWHEFNLHSLQLEIINYSICLSHRFSNISPIIGVTQTRCALMIDSDCCQKAQWKLESFGRCSVTKWFILRAIITENNNALSDIYQFIDNSNNNNNNNGIQRDSSHFIFLRIVS